MTDFIRRIITEACQKGITMEELEKRANIPHKSLKQWDKSIPSFDKILRVARVLNVSAEYLITGTNKPVKISSKLNNGQKKVIENYINENSN